MNQSRAERLRVALREEIVDAALTEFAERGYHAAGIADIAARCGIGHGTVYRHFANKRDLLDGVIDHLLGRVLAVLTADNSPDAAASLDEFAAQLERIANSCITLFEDDPRIARFLILEATAIDDQLTGQIMGVFDASTELIAAYLDNGVRRGFLRPETDARSVATLASGMLLGAVIHAIRQPADRDGLRRLADAAMQLLLSSLTSEDHDARR